MAYVRAPSDSVQAAPRAPSPIALDPAAREGLEPFFASPQRGDRFHNPWPNETRRTLKDVLRWKLGGGSVRAPGPRRTPQPIHASALRDYRSLRTPGRLLWLGHASFSIEIDGVSFMIDPVFGAAAGVVRRVTPLPLPLHEVPMPRVVLLTHGHHDHTDARSLDHLARRAEGELVFVVPRGLGSALPRRCRPVIEIGWWESITLDGVEVIFVPAQHWHRRGVADEDRCLWGGYVIRGSCALYHSGDTGYFGGFEAIGRVIPDIDVACLPLGAYEPRWFMGGQHMAPEQSLDAFQQLGARHFVGMHWGTFDLSDEAIDAGPSDVQRLLNEPGAPPHDRVHVLTHGGVIGFGGDEPLEVHGRFDPGAKPA